MALEDYLLPKENVKVRVDGDVWTWCATSTRIVRHRVVGEPGEAGGAPVGEVFQDLGYGEVSSVYRSRRKGSRLMDAVGVFLVVAGVAAAGAAAALYLGYLQVDFDLPLEVVAAASGAVSAAAGLTVLAFDRWRRHSYVRLYGDTVLEHSDGGVWRLETSEVDEDGLAKFMKIVRSGSNKKRYGGG